jgi:hypothetical protein
MPEWKLEGDEMRVASCPAGSIMLRGKGANSENDRCIVCPPRYYSTLRANYSENGPLVIEKEIDATRGNCQQCPDGSICDGGNHIQPDANYWRGRPMYCRLKVTDDGEPVFDLCKKSEEDLLSELALISAVSIGPGRREESSAAASQVRMIEKVYKCPPKMCSSKNESLGSNCRKGHTGVACALCSLGYTMKKGQCVACNVSPYY